MNRPHPSLALRAEITRRAAAWQAKANQRSGDDFNIIIAKAAVDLKTWFMIGNRLTHRSWLNDGAWPAIPLVIGKGLGSLDDLFWLWPETDEDWSNMLRSVDATYRAIPAMVDLETDEGNQTARHIINIRFWLHYHANQRSQTTPHFQEAA